MASGKPEVKVTVEPAPAVYKLTLELNLSQIGTLRDLLFRVYDGMQEEEFTDRKELARSLWLGVFDRYEKLLAEEQDSQ